MQFVTNSGILKYLYPQSLNAYIKTDVIRSSRYPSDRLLLSYNVDSPISQIVLNRAFNIIDEYKSNNSRLNVKIDPKCTGCGLNALITLDFK